MARPISEAKAGRIGVLGATSASGTHLRAAMADRGVPGSRVALFGRQREVAVLSEYDGEARLVQSADELEPAACDAVFVCEPGHDVAGLLEAAAAGTAVIDMTGTIPGAVLAGAAGAAAGGRVIAVPHPLSAMLFGLIAPLHRVLGLSGVSAFVLRPSSDFGEPGLEELREQTVHLLRFEPTPTEVFGRQLAFNVVPEHLFPADERDAGERVAREIPALFGSGGPAIVFSQALVPTFFGHGIAVHAALSRPATREDALAAWTGVPGIRLSEDRDTGTTLDAPEGAGLLVVSADLLSASSLRIWALGSEAGPAAASAALAAGASAGVL